MPHDHVPSSDDVQHLGQLPSTDEIAAGGVGSRTGSPSPALPNDALMPDPVPESVIRTPEVPTLAQMVRDGQQSAEKIKRATQTALLEWFAQSERLDIARSHYGLRGGRFTDFADRIGVDRSSAFQLVKLWQHRPAILSRCLDEGRYYGWETCLYWHEPAPRHWNRTYPHKRDGRSDERRTPKTIFQRFGAGCTLDVAATDANALCPQYFTKKQDGLKQSWHGKVWLNPPYSHATPWCEKAVEYARAGGTVIALLPAWTDSLFFHEFCALGRITFIRNRLVFLGGPGAHAPFASIIVEWTPETVQRHDIVLDARLDKKRISDRTESRSRPTQRDKIAA